MTMLRWQNFLQVRALPAPRKNSRRWSLDGRPGVTAVLLCGLSVARGQTPPKPEFDVASVRVVTAERPAVGAGRGLQCSLGPAACIAQMKAMPPGFGGPGSSDPGRMTFRRASVDALLLTAF